MQLHSVALSLARAGYVCACNEYRLSGEAKWPAMIHDTKAALRWTRAKIGLFSLQLLGNLSIFRVC